MFKRIKNLNNVQRLSLVALLFVLFCKMGGTTSAWFTHTDALNNHFGTKDYYVNIMVVEPTWESTGVYQAVALQPGMDIYKDPEVQNISDENCFIRMKYVIYDAMGAEITGDRLTAIQSAIKYYVSENNFIDYNTDSFVLNDGWYYYIGDDGNCAILEPLEITEPLFTDVFIPVLRDEFQYFSSTFKISVKAEAVFVSGVDSATVENVKERFESISDAADLDELGHLREAERLVIKNSVETGSAVSTSSFGEGN